MYHNDEWLYYTLDIYLFIGSILTSSLNLTLSIDWLFEFFYYIQFNSN